MKNKKRNRVFLLLILLLMISIGFALLSTQLNIFGVSNISAASWNIHWDNVANEDGIIPTTHAYIKDTAKQIVEYEIDFDEPGDYYEFTVDAVNEGTMDGEITEIISKVNGKEISTLPSYIKYEIKYADNGNTPAIGDVLTKKVGNTPGSRTYKVKIKYDDQAVTASDLDGMPYEGLSFVFEFSVKYSQANAMEQDPESFEDDPWPVIAACADNPNCPYKVGDTKEVPVDVNCNGQPQNFKVRIANKSTPDVCNNNDFSETACGFVIEFIEPIGTRIFNPYINADYKGNGNNGGWEYSDMRAYLNSGIYLKDAEYEEDYTSCGLYNALPADLKSVILPTRVISSHGTKDNANFTTTDNIYLLSTHEVWQDKNEDQQAGIDYRDTTYYNTRQLDYYIKNGTRISQNVAAAQKKDKSGNNVRWWLRSSSYAGDSSFFYVLLDGDWGDTSSNDNWNNISVMPVFRIGN